ncbi:hypothetical protein GQ600_2622 [Phytophthora cactorum]|nr:hypothetical protein GQ600_2622 [Phytophthora cactorum]
MFDLLNAMEPVDALGICAGSSRPPNKFTEPHATSNGLMMKRYVFSSPHNPSPLSTLWSIELGNLAIKEDGLMDVFFENLTKAFILTSDLRNGIRCVYLIMYLNARCLTAPVSLLALPVSAAELSLPSRLSHSLAPRRAQPAGARTRIVFKRGGMLDPPCQRSCQIWLHVAEFTDPLGSCWRTF